MTADHDTLALESILGDGSTASAVYRLHDDGTVRAQFALTSPEVSDPAAGLLWVRRSIGKDVSDAFQDATGAPANWLALNDGLRSALRPLRPGRRGRPIADLALLVQRYVEACAETKAPIDQLMRRFYPDYSKGRLNAQLRRAQDLGLIAGRQQGRKGGVMTAKCRRVLAGKGDL